MSGKREISLYSPHLIELMRAVFDKRLPFRFQARGYSMSPFIRDEDTLTVARFSGDYSVGDVLAFVRPGLQKLIVHRVVARRKGTYCIKGDNGFEIDRFVPGGNILGRVINVERKGQRVSLGLGKEKILIAWLSRSGLMPYLFFFSVRVLSFLKGNRNG
jgi:hypothetical protein